MEAFDRYPGSGPPSAGRGGIAPRVVTTEKRRSRPETFKAYQWCDRLSGGVICFMVVFTPWAFGTTQDWSIWTMNIMGYVLGCLLLLKRLIRRRSGYQPPRWDTPERGDEAGSIQVTSKRRDSLAITLGILT